VQTGGEVQILVDGNGVRIADNRVTPAPLLPPHQGTRTRATELNAYGLGARVGDKFLTGDYTQLQQQVVESRIEQVSGTRCLNLMPGRREQRTKNGNGNGCQAEQDGPRESAK